MIPTGLNGIRKISTFSLNSLLQCCKKKRGGWNCFGLMELFPRLRLAENYEKIAASNKLR